MGTFGTGLSKTWRFAHIPHPVSGSIVPGGRCVLCRRGDSCLNLRSFSLRFLQCGEEDRSNSSPRLAGSGSLLSHYFSGAAARQPRIVSGGFILRILTEPTFSRSSSNRESPIR